MSGTEQQIRERAYALWEQEGRPEGRELEHWRQASEELGNDADGQRPIEAATPVNVGLGSGLQPGGTLPGGGPGAGMGSIGTGGGSTANQSTGDAQRKS
jgi:hypothetical protein